MKIDYGRFTPNPHSTSESRYYNQKVATETTAKTLPRFNSVAQLPEDLVTLTSRRAREVESEIINKKPSLPVSNTERSALRESFSVYA